MSSSEFIDVTIDKSHIIRLYTESIEFVRELVNNAYDAQTRDRWRSRSQMRK